MMGIGLFFGVILAVAYRLLKVDEDPRIDETEEMLPGTNCGACGVPGCRAFAEELIKGSVEPSQCTVAPKDEIEEIAEFLGVDAGSQIKRVARLHCAGGKEEAWQIAEYQGFDSCRAAAVVSGGGKGCSWGCLGLADCEIACDFDAIHMNANGLPVVDLDKCTACEDCVVACPKDLFKIHPINEHLLVQCSAPLEGDAILSLCGTACDGCGRCATDANPGLIEMVDGLPVVDYSSMVEETPEATYRCPTEAIIWIDGGQFDRKNRNLTEGQKRYAQLR
ncbi:MAG: RnfABCDGE type electron transport complex subunit B [Gammaproteobacteria bacterium]|uniref:Ion-translocating oxidoreductase complex subunit B n=1 Tax=Candidatus Thiopontia autotrophica TaxID=2841688 RepID=A0A8J6NX73_9GAMM|nr:RnfABCDGE type electron transport complex subunit B [Candidatus Thiopontia autotrophica]MBL6968664.1 RnfABCDGE type electron transport complex subunit B [Gammaproteobacteria bacterium]